MAKEREIDLYCECCGGSLIKLNETEYKCDHCGNTKLVETLISSEVVTMLNQANLLRNKGEFDDAYDTFELIAKKDPNNPDAYWGMFLSEYGIMHVQDPVSNKFVPTCNRASSIAVFDNEEFKKVLELSNDIQKDNFISKAENIEKIRAKVIELSKHESPYDIFICYKRTQNIIDGKETYTEDAINARDIYEMLLDKGYKVFFAEKTLQNLAGTEYEPIIYNALNTSKIMLVVCSDPELINAPWVKNEWRRFIRQMEYDSSKKLIPIMCGGLKAGRLPDKLRKFQGLEMNATFQNNLFDSISRHIDLSSRSKISRINIGQQREVRKANANRSKVETRRIGDKYQVNFVVSDEKIIKLAFSFIEKEMYKDAVKELKFLSKDETLKPVVKFANQYIEFKSKDTRVDFSSTLNECIETCNENVANYIFDCLEIDLDKYLKNNNVYKASVIFESIMSWDNGRHSVAFEKVDSYIRLSMNTSLSLLDAVAKYYDGDTDAYLTLMQDYLDMSLKNFTFCIAEKILHYILEIDEGNIDARWRSFLLSFGAIDDNSIRFSAHNLRPKHIESFKEFLGYVPEESRQKYITYLTEGVARGVVYSDTVERLKADQGEGFLTYYTRLLTKNFSVNTINEKNYYTFNSTYFIKVSGDYKFSYPKNNLLSILKQLQKGNDDFCDKKANPLGEIDVSIYTNAFDELIKFYAVDEQESLTKIIFDMAESCKEVFEFAVAEKYYKLVLTENNTYHQAFWGILQCKLKCSVEEDLKFYAKKLSRYEEFSNAVHSAGICDDEESVDKYLSFQKADKISAKRQRKVVKVDREKSVKKHKFWSIATHVILFCIFNLYYLIYLAVVKSKK